MDLLQLTDLILEAWKRRDEAELERLKTLVPEGFSVCIIKPSAVHPTVALVRTEDVCETVEGFTLRLDGGVERKRTLIPVDEGGH